MAFRVPFRTMATTVRQSLKIGLIPADGIGKEVIPVGTGASTLVAQLIYKPGSQSRDPRARLGYTQARVCRFTRRVRALYEEGRCIA
jgi:hypothetical protein